MKQLQELYLHILFPVAGGMKKLNDSLRDRLLTISFFLLTSCYFVYHSAGYYGWEIEQSTKNFIGCSLLILVILFSIRGPLTLVPWNRKFAAFWFACGGSIFIAGVIHDIGEGFVPMQILMLFFMPVLYFVWNNRGDYDTLFRSISNALITSSLLYVSLCVYIAPLAISQFGFRYSATIKNPNFFALIMVAALACSLYLFSTSGSRRVFYMIASGVFISIILFTMSRTATLAAFAQIVICFIFLRKSDRREHIKRSRTAAKVLALLLIIAVTVPGTYTLLTAGNYGLHYLTGGETDARYVPFSLISSTNTQRMEVEGKSFRDFSAGRSEIWKAYSQKINLIGNDLTDNVKKVNKGRWTRSAHNTYLEIIFRAGLPAGLLFLSIAVLSGIYILKCVFIWKKPRNYSIFTSYVAAGFCITSMLESLSFPYMRTIMLLFFIAVAPLFNSRS